MKNFFSSFSFNFLDAKPFCKEQFLEVIHGWICIWKEEMGHAGEFLLIAKSRISLQINISIVWYSNSVNLQGIKNHSVCLKLYCSISFCSCDATIAELVVINQPVKIYFPETRFTGQYRSFVSEWCKGFGWIPCRVSEDASVCFVCIKALSERRDIYRQYWIYFCANWKKALEENLGWW